MSNSQSTQNEQIPTFKGAQAIRNTALALIAMGSLAMASCGLRNNDSSKRADVEAFREDCRGLVPDTFSMDVPETEVLEEGIKILKKGE